MPEKTATKRGPSRNRPEEHDRASLLVAVTSPIGFFVLALLIVEAFLGVVLTGGTLDARDRMTGVYLGVTMFVVVVAIVTLLVWFRSKAFVFDKTAHLDEQRIAMDQTRRAVVAQRVQELAPMVEAAVRNDLGADDLVKRMAQASEQDIAALLHERADRIANDIKLTSFFSVDFSALAPEIGTREYPVAAFRTMGDLLDELYFAIEGKVREYAYGVDWILRNVESHEQVRSLRVLTRTPVGTPVSDERTLEEVGIRAGTKLEVVDPRTV